MSHKPLQDHGSSGESTNEDGSDDDQWADVDAALVNLKPRRSFLRFCTCSAKTVCHCCFVCQFLIYLLVFPLWTKWLVTNPMPLKYWHEEFPPFPLIDRVVQEELETFGVGIDSIRMSDIPTTPEGCNFSCSAGKRDNPTAIMNFRVSITLNDAHLSDVRAHTVYPVLLASADFKDWWVVGDRRHAEPQQFWQARSAPPGHAYSYLTGTCTRPPTQKGEAPEEFTGSYILGCIMWDADAFRRMSSLDEISDADIARNCRSVGGVCGWSCESNIPPERLPGCTNAAMIQVTSNSIAGRTIPGAGFEGTVDIHECLSGASAAELGTCETTTRSFSAWKCHKCQYDPKEGDDDSSDEDTRRLQIPGIGGPPAGGAAADAKDDDEPKKDKAGDDDDSGEDSTKGDLPDGPMIYTSLPRFMVKVKGITIPEVKGLPNKPRAWVLTSSYQTPGVWKKVFMEDSPKVPAPQPVDENGKVISDKSADEEEEEPDTLPVEISMSKHAMSRDDLNRLEMNPTWCYGNQGPLYLVACVVNSSVYNDNFKTFKAGQNVAPPPFNDRCLAVGGRCAQACQVSQTPMPNCTSNGYINQSLLFADLHPQLNQSTPVWLFAYVLLIGFSVRVVLLCPGIFRPYPHCSVYSPDLTESFRYIACCVISTEENKATVLRSLIGAVSSMPKECRCRFHAVYIDEGHREDHKVLWYRLVNIISSIPDFGGGTYEDNISHFFKFWVDETKKIGLRQLGERGGQLQLGTLQALSGKSTLARLKRERSWDTFAARLGQLQQALSELEADLQLAPAESLHAVHDDVLDWEPKVRESTALRLHYVARARPPEDERALKAQHVAPGIWYYKVPPDARNLDWLALRSASKEMVYGEEGHDFDAANVPLRTGRGTTGGLNFASNYLSIFAERPDQAYGSSLDSSPSLFSICHTHHQYQRDFFHSTIPYFFRPNGDLDEEVAFTQSPPHYHEMQDRLDYLDANTAQFFRLNCMIRNCCGGVSSFGTNSTWLLKWKDDHPLWESEKSRVRAVETKRKRRQLVERRTFVESNTASDTATSLNMVVHGRRSQYINRRLSYGLAKSPDEILDNVRMNAEGSIVLLIQTFSGCQRGAYLVWLALFFFLAFIASLLFLLHTTDIATMAVELGLLSHARKSAADNFAERLMKPFVGYLVTHDYFRKHPHLLKTYFWMGLRYLIWLTILIVFLTLVCVVTMTMKLINRRTGGKHLCFFPSEMRWWGRLFVSIDNLTYVLWFWTAFFWIGFNYYSVFATRTYHFSTMGMFWFLLVIQLLSWGMVVASSARHSLESSMSFNEVTSLTLDNLWRSTQIFYISAPLLLLAIIKGCLDYQRYKMYGEDISFIDEDRYTMSKTVVRYWTLLLVLGPIAAWIFFFKNLNDGSEHGSLASCIIVTLIALDVLHPCAYLWVGENKMSNEEACKLTWGQALGSGKWWSRRIYSLILNSTVSGCVKYLVGPFLVVAMPILTLLMPYIGVNQAFMMLGPTTQR